MSVEFSRTALAMFIAGEPIKLATNKFLVDYTILEVCQLAEYIHYVKTIIRSPKVIVSV